MRNASILSRDRFDPIARRLADDQVHRQYDPANAGRGGRAPTTPDPNRLTADQIPLQSKMMAIADIFDALTAWDRPYKHAVPADEALRILKLEARESHVDQQLLDVFAQDGVYKLTGRA